MPEDKHKLEREMLRHVSLCGIEREPYVRGYVEGALEFLEEVRGVFKQISETAGPGMPTTSE